MTKYLLRFPVFVLWGCLFLAGIQDGIAQEANSVLVKVSRTDPGAITVLRDGNITVNYKLMDWYIAEADPSALEALEVGGIEYEILDRDAWSRPYYHIVRPQRESVGEIPEKTEVIYRDDREAIVKIDEGRIFDLGRAGFQFARLFRRPLPLVERKAAKPVFFEDRVRSDEVVGALINQVSQTTIREYLQRFQDFETRFVDTDSIYASGQWIYDLFVSFGYTDVILQEYYVSAPNRYNVINVLAQNVIATKPGILYPDSVFIIGGHYDSIVFDGGDPRVWAPGVDDNATGAVAALEAARVLADVDLDYTVKFACWSAEEIGLLGSEHYAEQAFRNGEKIGLYINFDMIGNVDPTDPLRDVNIGRNATAGAFSDLMIQITNQYTTLVPQPYVTSGGGSDHSPFIQNGYDILYGSEGDFSPNWHEGTDVIDNIDISYTSDVVKMGLGTLVTVAGPPESFPGAVIAFESADLDDDMDGGSTGNGNGFIDPGETVEVLLSLHNFGDAEASGVSARVITDDPFITLIDDIQSFGDIPANATGSSQGSYRFLVSEDAPNGRYLNFTIEASASGDLEWTTYFTVRVEQPEIEYQTFRYEETSGNGNNILDPGETVDLYISAINLGLRTATGLTAELTTEDPDVDIIDSQGAFPDMHVFPSYENTQDPFTFVLDDDADPHIILFQLTLSEESGFYGTGFPFRLLIGQGMVLLVVDDGGIDNSDFYTQLLRHMGVMYNTWEVGTKGKIPLDSLSTYGEVIWFTGSIGTGTLTEDDQTMIANYLDGGGHLFLSGNMIGFDIGRTPFYRDWLHAEFISFFTRLHHLESSPANPISRGMSITLATDGENAQAFTAETDPIPPAFSIFNYDRTTEEGPGDVRSSGSGALAFENNRSKLVYFSFGFEGIEPFEDRVTLLGNILSWFHMPAQLRGDVNGDGPINALDVVLAVRIALGTYDPTEEETERSDTNYDGLIDVRDIMTIVYTILEGSG